MEKDAASLETDCLNCGARVKGNFCHECGQRVRDNGDRSIRRLVGEVLGNLFFLDNRFVLSMLYLVRYPNRMTVEFLGGQRKKFISPVTLFLFLNLIYFFVNPLSDYSLSLYDQANSQPYSAWIKGMVESKLKDEGLEVETYSVKYQNTSDDISKSIMIINVPMIAVFVYLMAFKRRRFYFDSLIFAFHFFSLFMASWIVLDWVDSLIDWIYGHSNSMISFISFNFFAFILPLLYAMLGIKTFLNIRWYWAIPAGIGVMIALSLANFFYRFIIFLITFWVT